MIGSVQAREFTKNGALKFKIDGNWYFSSRDVDMSGVQSGDRIEFEWAEFGEDRGRGKPKSIQKWRPATNGSSASSASSAPSTALEDADRPFISNVVAHAIEAKLIQKPEDMEPWAIAALRTLDALKAGKHKVGQPRPEPTREPGSDDGIDDQLPASFYEGLPPPKSGRNW